MDSLSLLHSILYTNSCWFGIEFGEYEEYIEELIAEFVSMAIQRGKQHSGIEIVHRSSYYATIIGDNILIMINM